MTTSQHARHRDDLADPCHVCAETEAVTATGHCLPCAIEIATDAHKDALYEHARRGGTYDTRPVFIHPARKLPGAEEEEARRRLAAWQRFLAAMPEARPAIPSLYGGGPHDAGVGASQGESPGKQTDDRYESRDAVSSGDDHVSATTKELR